MNDRKYPICPIVARRPWHAYGLIDLWRCEISNETKVSCREMKKRLFDCLWTVTCVHKCTDATTDYKDGQHSVWTVSMKSDILAPSFSVYRFRYARTSNKFIVIAILPVFLLWITVWVNSVMYYERYSWLRMLFSKACSSIYDTFAAVDTIIG